MFTHDDNGKQKKKKEKNVGIYKLLATVQYNGEEFGFWSSTVWFYILVSPLTSCVNLGKLLKLCVVSSNEKWETSLTGLFRESHKVSIAWHVISMQKVLDYLPNVSEYLYILKTS